MPKPAAKTCCEKAVAQAIKPYIGKINKLESALAENRQLIKCTECNPARHFKTTDSFVSLNIKRKYMPKKL